MGILIFVIVVFVLIALVGIAVQAYRSSGTARDARDSREPPESDPTVGQLAIGPHLAAFHVRGETASTVFDVPLGDSEAGEHLIELLSHAAVEHVRAKSAAGLPLDGVHRIEVSAMRGDEPEVIATVELPEPGKLPNLTVRAASTRDLIAALNEVVADTSVTSQPTPRGSLESVAELVRLTGPSEALLRTAGVDPSSMSLDELTVGLLRAGGYAVTDLKRPMISAPTATVYHATKPGERLAVVVFPHDDSEYPEVHDRVFSEVAAIAGQSDVHRALLVSDKFSPYSMYERERRDKRLVFVTRERLQGFVDSFGLG
ncbi:MAG: hypothetical protein R2823_00225 [Acidimicrobiia bacterium]